MNFSWKWAESFQYHIAFQKNKACRILRLRREDKGETKWKAGVPCEMLQTQEMEKKIANGATHKRKAEDADPTY